MKPRCRRNLKAPGRAHRRTRGGMAHAGRAFTLVELLLSMTILSVLMLVVVNVIGIVQQQWTRSNSRVTAFREARMAFDLLARNLSQATLNTYWGTELDPLYFNQVGQQVYAANNYVRESELQFVCGKTTGLLTGAAGQSNIYPGHGVFFQAPLGVTRLGPALGAQSAETENMANLLCGRGYFVSWGDDLGFRPAFLPTSTVPPRKRYRLMEYSPTAESNQIYYDPTSAGNLPDRKPIAERSKAWFQDAAGGALATATSSETAAERAFTRPVADNIIALIISPQNEQRTGGGGGTPESIAPLFEYDSTLKVNPGASPGTSPQGTQHLLPPLLKITMVSLDSAAGEKLAEGGNSGQQGRLADKLSPLFTTASQYNSPSSAYNHDLSELQSFLVQEHLNFRVFTTTIVMKQSRWSR